MGEEDTFIPNDVLQELAERNLIQKILDDFLDKNLNDIFNRTDAKKMNYAVAFIKPEQTKSFLEEYEGYEQGRRVSPEPEIVLRRKKEEAYQILQENPYSTAIWRLNPSLVWQL